MRTEHIEFLVEEPSMEAALRLLVPKILGALSFAVYPFQCKDELLARIPSRLRAYSVWRSADTWFRDHCLIVVVVDRDDDDCQALKARLERMAREAGLVTRSTKGSRPYTVVNRLAIEELEAWYFGDWEAVRASYPRVPAAVPTQAKYRDPDAIKGGTWEAFERILQKAGYFRGGLPKIEAARAVAANMVPGRNTSRSFQALHQQLVAAASS